MRVLVLFRRDLRIHDNSALRYAEQRYSKKNILGLILFNKFQLEENDQNRFYFNKRAANFFVRCCKGLKQQFDATYCKLDILNVASKEHTLDTIEEYLKEKNIKEIVYNEQYTEYADTYQKKVIQQLSVKITRILYDTFLVKPFRKKPYLIFAAYYKAARQQFIPFTCIDYNSKNQVRQEALNNLPSDFSLLQTNPFNGTRLSKYINFGVISLRQVYNHVCSLSVLDQIKQNFYRKLHWRNYYLWLLSSGYFKYNNYLSNITGSWSKIKWVNDPQHAELLWNGCTGYCLIDAIVNQLISTGYISNLSRLILAFFSIKVLAHDPAEPRYGLLNVFSRYLIDGDCANNTGNTIWVLGPLDFRGVLYGQKNTIGGRMMDPRKLNKYEPYVYDYIRQYVDHFKYAQVNEFRNCTGYLKPMIDYEVCKKRWYSLTNFQALDEN